MPTPVFFPLLCPTSLHTISLQPTPKQFYPTPASSPVHISPLLLLPVQSHQSTPSPHPCPTQSTHPTLTQSTNPTLTQSTHPTLTQSTLIYTILLHPDQPSLLGQSTAINTGSTTFHSPHPSAVHPTPVHFTPFH